MKQVNYTFKCLQLILLIRGFQFNLWCDLVKLLNCKVGYMFALFVSIRIFRYNKRF